MDRHSRNAGILAAADLLKPMANPNRLAILCRLAEGEASVGEMEDTLGIRQPTLSQQLGELRKVGLIDHRRVAKSVFYRLSDERARALVGHLHELFCVYAGHEERTVSAASPQAPSFAVSSRGNAAVFAHVVGDGEASEETA